MTNVDKLKKKIADSGMSVTHIAKKTGILRETLYSRFKTGDFKLSEICALSDILFLTKEERNNIFFDEDSE